MPDTNTKSEDLNVFNKTHNYFINRVNGITITIAIASTTIITTTT